MAHTTVLRVPVVERRGRRHFAISGEYIGAAILAGVVGAVAMAAYLMIAAAIIDFGFWRPVNMIAATFPVFMPPEAAFDWGAFLTGVGLHAVTGAIWGALYALAVLYIPRSAARPAHSFWLGLIWGVVVWILMGLWIGPAINEAMLNAPPWNYFVAHLVYGVVTAWMLSALVRGGRRGREEPPVGPATSPTAF